MSGNFDCSRLAQAPTWRAERVDVATTINRAGLMLDPLNNDSSRSWSIRPARSRCPGTGPPEAALEADIWMMWTSPLTSEDDELVAFAVARSHTDAIPSRDDSPQSV